MQDEHPIPVSPQQYHDYHWLAGILYTSQCPVCEPWWKRNGRRVPLDWEPGTLFNVDREG